jgi:hypothetical protein
VHGLDRASLAVSLDADRFPFDPRYLWGPAPFGIPVLRQFTHEVVHFWAMLGSAYLANIALGDWRALRWYEEAGRFVEPEGAAASFTRNVPEVGFSPWQLHEALCRYWDIHIVGPELLLGEPPAGRPIEQELADWMIEGLEPEVIERLRATTPYTDEQLDRWMALEDDYARPYRMMVERLGSRTSVVLFPLVAYFAFQTPAPCETYAEAVAALVELRVVPETREPQSIHVMWREAFDAVRGVCTAASLATCRRTLTGGSPVVAELARQGNPVFGHYSALLASMPDPDRSIALPGDPAHRMQLVTYFLPPVTVFRDGRWEAESTMAKVGRANGVPGILAPDALADAAEAIRQRGLVLGEASLIRSLSRP